MNNLDEYAFAIILLVLPQNQGQALVSTSSHWPVRLLDDDNLFQTS